MSRTLLHWVFVGVVALCLVSTLITPQAKALVPAAQKAIQTGIVLIFLYYKQEPVDTQLLLIKELTAPLILMLQEKHKPFLEQMELIIATNTCTNSPTKYSKSQNKQPQNALCLITLLNKLANMFTKNTVAQKDVFSYLNSRKNYWDGIFYVDCAPKLIGAFDPSCFPTFLGTPIQSPRGGVQSNINSGSSDNTRPYSMSERSVCMRKIDDIRDCIDDTRDRIRAIQKDIQERKNVPPETKQSLSEIANMLTDFDAELVATQTQLSAIEDNERIRETTNNTHQQALHAYLDILRNRVSLLSAIVLVEKSVLPRNAADMHASFVKRNKAVLRKLKEMSSGVFSLYRQLFALPHRSSTQMVCLDTLRTLLSQLRASTNSVQTALHALITNPSPAAQRAYNHAVSSSITSGIALMKRYEQLRNQCNPKL